MKHRWSEPNRMAKKTERECQNEGCGIIKVTLHPYGRESRGHHPVEFYRDGEQIECKGTPPCKGRAKAKHATYAAEGYPL